MAGIMRANGESADDDAEQECRAHQTARSSLLRLPAEIRNRIYDFVVVYHGTLDIVAMYRGHNLMNAAWRMVCESAYALQQPPLTKACTEVRSETLPMFYGLNSFHGSLLDCRLVDTATTLFWLRAIGGRRTLLQNFTAERYKLERDRKHPCCPRLSGIDHEVGGLSGTDGDPLSYDVAAFTFGDGVKRRSD